MARDMTPDELADKQISRTTAAVNDYKAGVLSVTEAPGKKAAAKKDKMKAKLLARLDDGTWERRVSATSVEEWRNKTATKGANRISEGVTAAKPTIRKFWSQFKPHLEAVKDEVAKMPDVSIEDSVQRAAHNIRRNAEFRFEK
jgi:hypothetical protein